MVSVLVWSVVDRGFIGDVMVSVLASSVVDRGFIIDVMVSVLASSVVDRGFEPVSGQIKDYKIGMSEWLLCQLNNFYGENKFIFNEMVMRSLCSKTSRWVGFL
jgi:hypothetical protein